MQKRSVHHDHREADGDDGAQVHGEVVEQTVLPHGHATGLARTDSSQSSGNTPIAPLAECLPAAHP